MRILLYGEIILDRYFISITNRKAPECDIPIFQTVKIEDKLGGAANVAANLNQFCDLEFISVLGNDDVSKSIINLLNSNSIKNKIFFSERKSIIKNRTICNNKIVHRLDIEDTFDIPENLSDEIILYLESKFISNKIDGFILSDYNKGIIPINLSKKIIELCNKYNVMIFVDPKIKDINKYYGCTFFKPNYSEALEIISNYNKSQVNLNPTQTDINHTQLVITLYKIIGCKYLLITLGSDGMIGYDGVDLIRITHTNPINLIDVTGAGDIVISVFSYIFILSNDFGFSCQIANSIAGKSVEVLGNYKFSIEDIKNSNKIIHSKQIDTISNIRKIHSNIVFTNGCFDIVHTGHIKLLRYCKSIGDVLILGLNSDSSIKRLKGESRPINKQEDRIEFIQLLDFVDYIIVFDEDSPYNILSNLKPDILVKGSDYSIDNVIGKEFASKVELFNLIPNKSTTGIIKKIIG